MQDELEEEESGKETDYKHLEHGLEISGSRYAMKGFWTYKERLHTMASRAISTATSNEHGTGIQEGTRGVRRWRGTIPRRHGKDQTTILAR